MRLGLEPSPQQQQRLVLTPGLREALTVLQLPALELERYVEQQVAENPLLEVPEEESHELVQEAGRVELSVELSEEAGPEEEDESWAFVDREGGAGEGKDSLAIPAPAPTLHQYLHDQLRLLPLSPPVQRVARFLVDSLDENGYLTLDLEEAGRACGQPVAVVREAVRVVQGLDPPGVGARSLEECLLIQWEVVGDGNPLVPVLIREHLADVAAGRFQRIARALGTTPAQVRAAVVALRALDPKPGRRFAGRDPVPYIYPDVTVQRAGPEWVVLVNEPPRARPIVSPAYRGLLAAGTGLDPETRSFLERKLRSALWLLKCLEQRRVTLRRVVEGIVEWQQGFFEKGPRFLRPLTLRQLAETLGTHESTVSRAIAGKYMQTPRGLFPIKYFFARGVESDTGGLSAECIRSLIADLVAAEDPGKPLSDQEIADALARQGIHISRRTVAKYRVEAGIPSSAHRRRLG